MDIFGVTSKIELFMFFSSKINNWYLNFMMQFTLEHINVT